MSAELALIYVPWYLFCTVSTNRDDPDGRIRFYLYGHSHECSIQELQDVICGRAVGSKTYFRNTFLSSNKSGAFLKAKGRYNNRTFRTGIFDSICQTGNLFLRYPRPRIPTALDNKKGLIPGTIRLCVNFPVGSCVAGNNLFPFDSAKPELGRELVQQKLSNLLVGSPLQ